MTSEKGSSNWYAEQGAWAPGNTPAGAFQRGAIDAFTTPDTGPKTVFGRSEEEKNRAYDEKVKKENDKAIGRAGLEIVSLEHEVATATDVLGRDQIEAMQQTVDNDREALRNRESAIEDARRSVKNALTFGGDVRATKKELGTNQDKVDDLLWRHGGEDRLTYAAKHNFETNATIRDKTVEYARGLAEKDGVGITDEVVTADWVVPKREQ